MGKHLSTLLDDPVDGRAVGEEVAVVLLLPTISMNKEGHQERSTDPPGEVRVSVKFGVETASRGGFLL